MQYTVLGKTGLRVSRLGFGCMRLPMKGGREVDRRESAIPLLRRAHELGVNLFDTAVGYCGGDSQRVLGEAFEDVRESIVLSTKNHHYNKNDKAGWWKNLEDSLERLRTDHIDIYNHHALNYNHFEAAVAGEDGLYREMLRAKEQGLIRHIGFSFHGPLEHLIKLIDTGLFETLIVQYNLLDRSMEEGIAHAAESGMGVMIMGPVGGGRLGYPSEKAASLVGEVKSTPELALRFVLSNKNVHVALSGMNTMQQLEENVATVSRAGELTEQDHARISAAIEERKRLTGLYCTGCNYCMPCPAGVDIPANFEILNLERVFGLTDHARERYASLAGQAALCRLCGKCLETCPQKIDIPARLGEVVKALDPRAGTVAGWTELRGGSLSGGQLRLKLRYVLKNFSDAAHTVGAEFLPHGEDRVEPAAWEVGRMEPYARAQKDLELVLPCPGDAYSLDVLLRCDGAERLEHAGGMLAVARKREHGRPDVSRRRAGTVHVPCPACGQPDARRSFDFSVAYDEEKLYVFAEVEDELLDAGAAGAEGRTRSRLQIRLDGRTPYMLGRPQNGQGALRLALAPSGEDRVEVNTSPEAQVEALCRRTGTGYRVECAVPWAAFVQVPSPPAVIGFDVGMVSCDAEGNVVAALNWASPPDAGNGPQAPGRLVTV